MPIIVPDSEPLLTLEDLPAAVQSAELVGMMIAGANAKAARVAPCLVATDTPPSAEQLAEAKLVLAGAVKRWSEAGAGALQAQTAGPYGMTVDTRQRTGFNLWPSEIKALQDICKGEASAKKAYGVDTAPSLTGVHADWCSLNFGATYCSCGADIAGYPIFEQA